MSEDLKQLIEKLSRALNGVIQDSEQIRVLLKGIEEAGHDADITLAIVLSFKNQNNEIHKIVYGPERGREKKSVSRRISAFDRRFLRALRIQLPD